MSDDYQSTIANLITVRDTLVTDLSATAADLAALVPVADFSESGDGGGESIDSVGLRRQLMDEIREKGQQIKELSITIASLQGGMGRVRIPVNGRPCRWLR